MVVCKSDSSYKLAGRILRSCFQKQIERRNLPEDFLCVHTINREGTVCIADAYLFVYTRLTEGTVCIGDSYVFVYTRLREGTVCIHLSCAHQRPVRSHDAY